MPKKRTTLYLTEKSDNWLTEKAQEQGTTKNGLLQQLINKAMEQARNDSVFSR